jgi:hypothetical protein
MPAIRPCAKCSKPVDVTSMTTLISLKDGSEIDVCFECRPGKNPPIITPKPVRTLPYKTLAEAVARAEKVAAHFGRPTCDIGGNGDVGYRVYGDSEAVPGFKPVP